MSVTKHADKISEERNAYHEEAEFEDNNVLHQRVLHISLPPVGSVLRSQKGDQPQNDTAVSNGDSKHSIPQLVPLSQRSEPERLSFWKRTDKRPTGGVDRSIVRTKLSKHRERFTNERTGEANGG